MDFLYIGLSFGGTFFAERPFCQILFHAKNQYDTVKVREENPGKIFYTMGEVAEMFDVNQSLIRFWEQRFDVLKPKKNKKGNRLFTPADIKNLEIIYHLVKEQGMTLAGAEKRLKENPVGAERDTEIIKHLQEVRAVLQEIREELKDGAAAPMRPAMSGYAEEVFERCFPESLPKNDLEAIPEPMAAAVVGAEPTFIPGAETGLLDETLRWGEQVHGLWQETAEEESAIVVEEQVSELFAEQSVELCVERSEAVAEPLAEPSFAPRRMEVLDEVEAVWAPGEMDETEVIPGELIDEPDGIADPEEESFADVSSEEVYDELDSGTDDFPEEPEEPGTASVPFYTQQLFDSDSLMDEAGREPLPEEKPAATQQSLF
jgi:DNA-binding transcriptional MerR regulator